MVSTTAAVALTFTSLIGGFVAGSMTSGSAEKQLTNTDIAEPVCTPEYMERHGEGLCRELFCRMSSNKTDGKTGAQECEQISNIINSQYVYNFCNKNDVDAETCFRYFRERK